MKRILLALSILLLLGSGAYSQFGGTKALTDTQTVANKFHVFRLNKGQRIKAAKVEGDTLAITESLYIPLVLLPTCNGARLGQLAVSTANDRLYFCNGSTWNIIA